MKNCTILLSITLLLQLLSATLYAQPLDLSHVHNDAIGQHLSVMSEAAEPLTLDQARQHFQANGFTDSNETYFNGGIDTNPIWLVAEFNNPLDRKLQKQIVLESSWIDQITLHIVRPNSPAVELRSGDTQTFESRPIKSRNFVFEHDFLPGSTQIFIRLQTPDAMTLPIYVRDIYQQAIVERRDGYLYGFIYGAIISLMLYNLILAISLKNPINLYYSVYMLAFLAMNLSYTGHGFAWLWPDNPQLQQWSIPFFMGCYMVWGLYFGIRFLNLKQHMLWLHRAILSNIIIICITIPMCIVLGAQGLSITLAFIYMLIFSVGMVALGAIALQRRLPSANLFLIATLLGVTGALITASTVWGIISYDPVAYLAIDIGMMSEAVLLSLALANQLNQIKNEKIQAERLARIDPLTTLNNRRAFDELVNPIWSNAIRNNRTISLIMIDIDRFKLINDEFGHLVGDRVIQTVAQHLNEHRRAGDILARWGGEEFIVLLPETSLAQASSLAERYRTSIEEIDIYEQDAQIQLSASFGVASRTQESDNLDHLITAADNLLYVAKKTGRNKVCAQNFLSVETEAEFSESSEPAIISD